MSMNNLRGMCDQSLRFQWLIYAELMANLSGFADQSKRNIHLFCVTVKASFVPHTHDYSFTANGTELTAELGAVSAEHLICATDEGIRAMREGGTTACCLPATSFYLNADFARARDMITAGVPVAIATDFNPGSCPNLSLQFAMNLGCYKYRLTPAEVLTAVTLNAAAAIRRADTLGTLEPGKKADLVIWKADNLDFLFYRFGNNLAGTVIKAGEVVIRR